MLTAVLVAVALSPAALINVRAAGAGERPTIERVDATRFVLSHGRLQRVRNAGIAAGLPGVGAPLEPSVEAAYRNIPGITASTYFPGPATVLQVIDSDPMITLDDDGDGVPDETNTIVQAAAWLPASFSLLVAEGVSDTDGDPVGVRWRAPRGGTLYATVPFADRGIVPGTALTTAQLIEGYAANSVLYEAPDVGFPIQDSNQDGGVVAVSARAVDASADGRPGFSNWESRLLGYANPMDVNIIVAERWDAAGSCWVTFRADIDQSFGHPDSGLPVETYTTFRWEVGDLPIEDVTGSPDLAVTLGEGFHKVTLVASNMGPYSTLLPALLPSPFVHPPNGAPFTSADFSSYGSTLSDTDTIDCEPPDERRRSLRVEKHPEPGVVIAPPGWDVTYTVTITNDGEVPVTIDRIEDVVRGVRRLVSPWCEAPLPVELAVGASLVCSFSTFVDSPLGGQHRDTAVIYGHDEQGNQVIGRGQATVRIAWPDGSLVVSKRASVKEIDIPGGTVEYWVEVGNPSDTTDVTVESVIDDRFGDLAAYCDVSLPVTLKPRETLGCHFEARIQGKNNTLWANTVTVSGTDANGSPVTATARADVLIKDFVADLTVLKGVVGGETFLPEADSVTIEYFFVVVNESEWDAVTLTDVTDVADGSRVALDVDAACEDPDGVPTLTIPPQGWILCRFKQELRAQPGDTHVDQLFVEGIDEDGYPPSGRSNQVAVSFKDLPSSIEVTKVADPVTLPAAGGSVTYRVTVRNTSEADTVTITSISDDRLTSTAGCRGIVGTALDPGEAIECSLLARIDPTRLPGYGSQATLEHVNTVTVTALDDDGKTIHDDGTAVVTVAGGTSCISVTKSANPVEVFEPGGPVLFTVVATNCSDRPFTIVGVSDDTYPTDVARCYPSLVGTVVEPGDSVLCNFLARVEGRPADPPHVDVATVAVDDRSNRDDLAIGQGSAEVRIRDLPSSISVSKSGELVAASDGSAVFRFRVVVANTSRADEVTIDDVIDFDVGGRIVNRVCSPALGTSIRPGHRLECTFFVHVFGQPGTSHFDLAVAIGTDDDGEPVSGSAATTVTLPEASLLVVSKTADPSVVDEPGEDDVRFSVAVRNASVVNSVTITSIDDSRRGGIAGDCGALVGVTLAPGEVRRCAYTSPVIGQPGEYPNVVTVRGRDEYDRPVSASAEAIVTIRDVPAQIEVTKEADRASAESGEVVNYSVTVRNVTPFVDLVIASVVDDRVGDVGRWCAPRTPAPLAPGRLMICRYPGVVTGEPGDVFVNIVTASTEKPWFWGQPATDSAGATVLIEKSAPPDEGGDDDEAPEATDKPVDEGSDTGTRTGAWELFDVLANPRNGDLVYDSPRTTSSCSLGDGELSIAHAKFSFLEPTVDVTLVFSYEAPPGVVPAGELVELPMELSVAGMHDSENAGATAGFAGYGPYLSVSACSLSQCSGSPDARPQQPGVAAIRFPGPPIDPAGTFAFEAFINDTSPIGGDCRVRYVYEYAPGD